MERMIYTIEGVVVEKGDGFVIIRTGGVGFKLLCGKEAVRRLPREGSDAKCFCALRIHDERAELFGFLDEPSLKLFEILTTVPGVGPKSALSVLDTDHTEGVIAAILEKRVELLTRASGIGKKTAERIVVELQNKLELRHASRVVGKMNVAVEVEDALVGLGYDRREARSAIAEAGSDDCPFEERLRLALKVLGKISRGTDDLVV